MRCFGTESAKETNCRMNHMQTQAPPAVSELRNGTAQQCHNIDSHYIRHTLLRTFPVKLLVVGLNSRDDVRGKSCENSWRIFNWQINASPTDERKGKEIGVEKESGKREI